MLLHVATVQEYRVVNCMMKKRDEESKDITTGGQNTET